MPNIDRRRFVGSASALGLGALLPGDPLLAQTAAPAAGSAPDATRLLAGDVVHARAEDLPARVRSEASRTLLNRVGCTVGGAQHETAGIAVRALGPFGVVAAAAATLRRRARRRSDPPADRRLPRHRARSVGRGHRGHRARGMMNPVRS